MDTLYVKPLLLNTFFMNSYRYVVVNFLSQLIFVFLLFLGVSMHPTEVETKEKNNYLR